MKIFAFSAAMDSLTFMYDCSGRFCAKTFQKKNVKLSNFAKFENYFVYVFDRSDVLLQYINSKYKIM